MSQISLVGYKTFNEVKRAFVGWEEHGYARDYAIACMGCAIGILTGRMVTQEEGIDGLNSANNQLQRSSGREKACCEIYTTLHRSGILNTGITRQFVEIIIGYHARGEPTAKAVECILTSESYAKITPFFYWYNRLSHPACEGLVKWLRHRVYRYKQGHVEFPKKYESVWREKRESYLASLQDIPLTDVTERIHKLSEHYMQLEEEYAIEESVANKERIHKCMMRTMAAIHVMTGDKSTSGLPPATVDALPPAPDALPPVTVKALPSEGGHSLAQNDTHDNNGH